MAVMMDKNDYSNPVKPYTGNDQENSSGGSFWSYMIILAAVGGAIYAKK